MLKTPFTLTVGLTACLTAQSAVTITDGNATFGYTSYPTTTTSAGGFANFAAAGTDHCYQSWWYYAVTGDATGSALNTSGGQMTITTAADGRSTSLDWANVDGRNFAANLDVCVYSTGAATGVCAQSLTLTNNTSSPLTLTVFKYVDYDVNGSAGDSSVQEPSFPAGNHVVSDGTTMNQAWVLGKAFSAAQAGAFASIRAAILGTQPFVPNGNIVFGPGDYSGVLSWTATIAPSTSQTFEAMLSIGAVPVSQQSASATTHCVAKAGTNGLPAWSTNRPFLGATVNLQINNGFNGSAPIVFLGTSATNVPFPPFGTVCTVPVTTLSMPAFSSGVSTVPLPIPNSAALGGATLHMQGLFVDPGAAGNVAHTDGLAWTLGSFGG